MTPLSPDDFPAFFAAVHGVAPFPWQTRLLGQVAAEGAWPALLDLPTGCGKTAALDVALFHLALEAGAAERRAPLRVVMVVDRRTIVDQAHERATRIRDALDAPKSPVVAAVAARLRAFSGEAPLEVALLRGGVPREDAWARRPDQPVIALSTVDQVGSRLLFRGYGVSDAMRPVHAGLLGNDVLFLLDEVHLSRPFAETLRRVASFRGDRWREVALPDRFAVVEMSATPAAGTSDRFALDDADRADVELRRRLSARKPATLAPAIRVTGSAAARTRMFSDAVARHARAEATPGRVVGVVVNRVATAREVYARLHGPLGEDVVLVTGRMRPLDRTDVEKTLRARAFAGRTRTAEGPPLVVVATQTIEAGADLDFDVLVTEGASLDALRQRFGRLDRLGRMEGAGRGIVLVRADALGKDAARDPVYGEALARTWSHLASLETVDFGLDHFRPPEDAGNLVVRGEPAPVLLPAHLDAWAQTAPVPRPDPDVSLWLHGPARGQPEVQIVWRADVTDAELAEAPDRVVARVEACPPGSGEVLSVPIGAARRWLAGDVEPDELGDVEGARAPDEAPVAGGRVALAWRGERSVVVGPGEIAPGDTLVVPWTRGGLTAGNWDPAANAPVRDLGERVSLLQRGRLVMRLHDDVIRSHAGLAPDEPLPEALRPPRPGGLDEESAPEQAVTDWIRGQEATSPIGADLRSVSGRGLPAFRLVEIGDSFVLVFRRRVRARGAELVTEDDHASFAGVAVPLRAHLRGVGEVAAAFARALQLPASVRAAVELAGRWHDAGKADPRFQRMLRGGGGFADATGEPLAKSAMPPGDVVARRRARERSGYPAGGRHELTSVALMQQSAPPAGVDWDLVLHLVASHHGHCRPFAPFAPDPKPVTVAFEADSGAVVASSDHGLERLDSGVSERFWALVRRYGWHPLAWLEAVLRLADHRRSEQEQEQPER